jgi:C4-dicarboxylate-specific signal transduction histidine kinase
MPDGREQRRHNPGRREEDWFYLELARRMERLEDRFEKAVERCEKQADDLEDAYSKRLAQLEEFHISDKAETRLKVAQETNKLQTQQYRLNRWQKWAIVFGMLAAASAIASLVVSIIALTLH